MRRNVFGGLFLIFLGIIAILNNFGYIGWDIWWAFLEFWPLILVAIGLRLLFRNNVWIQIVAFLLIVIIPLAYYFGYGNRFFPHRLPAPGQYQTFNWSLEKDEKIKEAKLDLQVGAGRINLSSTDKLADLEASTHNRPDIDTNSSDSSKEIKIRQDLGSFSFLPRRSGGSESWVLGLGKNIIWDLKLKTGAGTAECDLSETLFKRLDMETGAGKVRLVLGEMEGEADIDIDTGAGEVTLVIPENIGVKATLHTGVGSKNLSGRDWQQNGDTHTSANYGQAVSKVRVNIDSGVGSITIRTP